MIITLVDSLYNCDLHTQVKNKIKYWTFTTLPNNAQYFRYCT